MSVKMRAIEPEELPAAASVVVAAFNAGYQEILSPQALSRMTPDYLLTAWRGADDLQLIGAYLHGILVGVARIGADPSDETGKTGHLFSLYVAPDHHGYGIGSVLLGAAVGRLTEAGYTEATLWVFEANSRALALYGKTWKPTGEGRTEADWEIPQIKLARKLGAE